MLSLTQQKEFYFFVKTSYLFKELKKKSEVFFNNLENRFNKRK
jgi:hypothetical protein